MKTTEGGLYLPADPESKLQEQRAVLEGRLAWATEAAHRSIAAHDRTFGEMTAIVVELMRQDFEASR